MTKFVVEVAQGPGSPRYEEVGVFDSDNDGTYDTSLYLGPGGGVTVRLHPLQERRKKQRRLGDRRQPETSIPPTNVRPTPGLPETWRVIDRDPDLFVIEELMVTQRTEIALRLMRSDQDSWSVCVDTYSGGKKVQSYIYGSAKQGMAVEILRQELNKAVNRGFAEAVLPPEQSQGEDR